MRIEPFTHPKAINDSRQVGTGTNIWAFAHVMPDAKVGCNCNIGDHCFVEGGATIGDRCTIKNGVLIWDGVHIEDDVFVGPGVVFTNDVHPRSPRMPEAVSRYADVRRWREVTKVCQGASIGAGAIILPVVIGEYAMVGAGAVVTKDVPRHTLVLGNPAREVDLVCRCGLRVDAQMRCKECGVTLSTT